MKVLFLLTQDLDSPAGVGRYFPLAKALVARGHKVSIAALHANYAGLRQAHACRSGVGIRYVGQMHVKKIGDNKHYFSPLQLIGVAGRATWSLGEAALRTPADVVIVGKAHPMNGFPGLIAKVVRRLPMVLDCDDLEAVNNRFSGRWQSWLVEMSEKLIMRAADHITTHTSVICDHLTSMGIPTHRITYLPHGVDRDRFALPEKAEIEQLRQALDLTGRKTIAFIGSLSLVSHALDVLMAAFAQVQKRMPEATLLIVGGGEDIESLKQQASDLGVLDSVRFTGRVDPTRVPLYYRLVDVAVDPVHDNDAGRASLSLKMFESWAAGVPLVTVDVGDRMRMLGSPPAGRIVSPGDPGALADAIGCLLSESVASAALHHLGLERIDGFYWDQLAEHVESVLIAAIAARRSPTG